MPALFAYLLAIGLLLGGGYGALSWLAAPEPVKVTAKAKPARPSPRHYPQNPETPTAPEATMAQANSAPVGGSDHVAPGSGDQTPSPAPDAKAEADEKGAANAPSVHSAMAEPAQDNKQDQKNDDQNPAAAAATPAPPKPDSEQPAQTASTQRQAAAISPSKPAASATNSTGAKISRTPHLKLGHNSHSGKPALALMTLRTIELPDGRRFTRLIPYQGGGGEMAYDDNE